MTKRQREVLDFIEKFTAEFNYSPSLAEIGKRLQMSSPATVFKHLGILQSEGFIRRKYNRKRSIEVVGKKRRKHCRHCGKDI